METQYDKALNDLVKRLCVVTGIEFHVVRKLGGSWLTRGNDDVFGLGVMSEHDLYNRIHAYLRGWEDCHAAR